ncbi:MAG TPA: DUF3450 family protein [Opitutus sp.]|nr:DUF3450 family protein [Opitutus sp.]
MNIPFLHLGRMLSLLLLLPAAFSAEPDTIRAVEKSASEWVKMRAETVRLETDWASDQVLLKSTINALTERAQLLEERRDELKAKTAEERAELEDLTGKRKVAAKELALVEQRLKTLTAQLMELRPALPPRLSDALEMSFRSLTDAELSVGERMQLAMTVLNRCAQFNRSMNHGAEVLAMDGEAGAKSLEVIYWGLSHGYAIDPAAGKAWWGSPGADGWKWEPRPEAVTRVAELIAIHTDKADVANSICC